MLMTTPRLRKLLLSILLPGVLLAVAYSAYENYDWPVPEAAKQMRNPLAASPAEFAAARSIYSEKCANCHGDSGKGDGPDAASYYPSPADLSDTTRMRSISDGEIFYRITNGRRPMPSFKRKLTDEQRWQLVLLIRSFAGEAPKPH